VEEAPDAFIRYLFRSPCNTVIVPMQDILNLDGSARMNFPGTIGGNWGWRMRPDALTEDLTLKYFKLNKETDRR
jgi:4-alpha-glucanotransferase